MNSRLTYLEQTANIAEELIDYVMGLKNWPMLDSFPIPSHLVSRLITAKEQLELASSIPNQVMEIAHRRGVVSVPCLVSTMQLTHKEAGEVIQELVDAGKLQPTKENVVVFEPTESLVSVV